MNRYVVCTQQTWGVKVWSRLAEAHPNQVALAVNCLPDVLGQFSVAPSARYRYLFFVHWSALVPAGLIDVVEAVNFHCTDLPYGRGGHPIENLILRGHKETSITAHRMTAEFDAGPVYGKEHRISLTGCRHDILERFVEPVTALALAIIAREPVPIRQVGDVAIFRRLSPEAVRKVWEARGC